MAEMEGVLAWWFCSIKILQHWFFKCEEEANEGEGKKEDVLDAIVFPHLTIPVSPE